ncbi:porin [Roseicyclus mahoneyensis]|uniref:Outer membrane protein OmpU n=1 Tax=Roseicyclus mahoneyensis TaxID=164332 RepID=A0A316GIM6_9RHOB|nr:porin [Roseicyclus mahoneyensis]PWK59852.1 outer membrane protein OmpU [Roseicyclus mahoneyensis]
MKKVLFATTALVAFAGAAAADVTVTGSAEMGIAGGTGLDVAFFQSVDVRFALTGQTDNGLSFGATIDLDDASDRPLTTGLGDISSAFADFTVFVRGSFGTLTLGDTDGAFDWAMTEVNAGSPGSINDAETGHGGFNGNSGYDGDHNGQILRYDYTVGDFGFALSAEVQGNNPSASANTDDAIIGLGFRYGLDFGGGRLNLGLGYQTGDHGGVGISDLIGVSASVALDSGLTATVNYSEGDLTLGSLDETHIGLGVSYEFDAITLHANWGQFEEETTGNTNEGFGLAAAYDLGGGASMHLGYGDSDCGGAGPSCTDGSRWSLGLAMSF